MTYTCSDCFRKFNKDFGKGRKPKRCENCREKIKDKWRKSHTKEK